MLEDNDSFLISRKTTSEFLWLQSVQCVLTFTLHLIFYINSSRVLAEHVIRIALK
jgi:hypothetical protein